MQIPQPFVSSPRNKTKLYRRTHLRALDIKREEERQEQSKLVKLRQRKWDYEWRVRQERGILDSTDDSQSKEYS